MKLLLRAAILIFCATTCWGQDSVSSYNFQVSGVQGPGSTFRNTGINSFLISWAPAGSVSSCSVQVDSSADGVTWGSGDLIASQNCASIGSSSIATLANGKYYVRVHVTALNGPGVNVTLKSWGGVITPGVATPAGQPGDTQINSGGVTLGAGGCNDTGTQYNCDRDVHIKGPSGGVDVTRYGAVPINQNAVPAPTVTINSGSNQATFSSTTGFQNGYGIAISGPGAAQTMTTPVAPTVTPSCAASLTGTGYTVPAASGSLPFAYSLVQRDQGGGFTAASPDGTTTTGNTLGVTSTTGTSYSISGTTVTAVVPSNTGLAVGCMIDISGTTDDPEFGGQHRVTAVPDGTHISYTVPSNSAFPMTATTATGGTIYWWLCNHITYAAPSTGGTQFWIYGRNAGSEVYLKTSILANLGLSGEATYNSWDDFGATLEASPVKPWWAPSAPPSSPVNDMLVTTIASIGTPVTLAANASTSVTAAPARFDNAPAIQAAWNASYSFNDGGGGAIRFPVASEHTATPGLVCYVTSSYLVLAGALKQDARICAGDTIEWGGGNWEGDIDSAIRLVIPGFGMQSTIDIIAQGANPVIWDRGNVSSGGSFRRVTIPDGGNEGVGLFITDTQAPHLFENDNLEGNDFMGVPVYYFSTPVNGGLGGKFERCSFIGGGGNSHGVTMTPKFISKNDTFWNFDYISGDQSGFYFTIGSFGGMAIDFRLSEDWQGGNTPLITINNTQGGAAGGFIALHHVNLDTDSFPMIAQLGMSGTYGGSLLIEGANLPGSSAPLVSGSGFNQLIIENAGFQDYSHVGQNFGIVGFGLGAGTIQVRSPSFYSSGTQFANLGTPVNGTFTFCPDCTIANPCAGSGTGAFAKRLNGVWVCN